MKKPLIQIIFLSLCFNSTIYVPHDYLSIQEAINVSIDNDTILVSQGEYYENINYFGKKIVLIGENKDNTIINGSQNSSVVTFESEENNNSILDGFSIVNGKNQYGGGIHLNNSNPIIRNINLYNNIAEGGGGAGLYCIDADPIIKYVNIFNNNSDDVGGGIYLKGNSKPICSNIAIFQNNSSGAGGGVFVRDQSEPHFNHSTIILNQTDTWGGGIAGKYGVNIKITNSIVRENFPQQLAMSEFDDNMNVFLISTSNIHFEQDSIQIGNNDNIFWLEGNIDQDPLFNNEELIYEIDFNSPCIDLGIEDTMLIYNNNQDSLYIEPYDYEGLGPDIGAYEFICEFPAYYDDCGICSFGNTGHEPNSDMDDCGICFGDNEDVDCAGLCFGDAYIDECGVCDDIINNDNECITTVQILDNFIESGSQSNIEISLNNSIGVVGFQLEIENSPNLLRTMNVLSTARTESFNIFHNEVGNTLYIAAFNEDLNMILPGTGPILEIVYQADNIEEEQDVLLSLSNIILSDNNAEPILSENIDGIVTILIDFLLGDLNSDQIINILDTILLVEIIINEEEYIVNADLNSDDFVNVIDVILLVEIILNS